MQLAGAALHALLRPGAGGASDPILTPSEQLSSTIGLRRAAHDVVHPDSALGVFEIEEYAIFTYSQAELGWLVSQWPHVTVERIDRELVERSIDPATITQRKLSQIFFCAPREDQLPTHA
jgi:hypothetical protein